MGNAFLKTDLKGRANNFRDFKNEALLPVFEAVANSIHAIEDKKRIIDGNIRIKIIREHDIQTPLDGSDPGKSSDSEEKEAKILKFEIIDDGIGFTKENFDSFCTADSTHKLMRGGKGVGRFTWLKAFEKVNIESVYEEKGHKKLRIINFSIDDGIEQKFDDFTENDKIETKIKLIGFKEAYRTHSSAYKTTKKIATRILEHCLSFYIGGIAPSIIVEDGKDEVDLSKIFNKIKSNIETEDLEISGWHFKISHVRLYSTYSKVHQTVFCANKRAVTESPIKKLGSSILVDDDNTKFIYAAYISGDYLDENVDSMRASFIIKDVPGSLNLEGKPIISIDTIKLATIERSKIFLSKYLKMIKNQKMEIVSSYVSSHPTLRAVLKYCPELLDEIEVNSSPEAINGILYKYKGISELNIINKHEKLLKTQATSLGDIEGEITELIKKLEDFNKDQLTEYIVKRKMIIEILEKKLRYKDKDDKKYFNEEIIHDILFPRKTTSDIINYEDHNLWIIDELLTFHEFAASDLELGNISTSDSKQRPDIVIFSEKEENQVAKSVSIIELKKPQRENVENPITQMYKYIDEIKNQKIQDNLGRDLIVNEFTKFYCYAICDLKGPVKEYARYHNMSSLKGGLGYYSYNSNLNAYTEILAFDKLIDDVKKRHKIFFKKLGI